MSYSGGTLAAQEFINKYKTTGHLIDVYSDEWMRANPKLFPTGWTLVEKNRDARCQGHLLILYVDRYHDDLFQDMKKIYEPFKYVLDYSGQISPSFIFINLNIKEIFCIGLGRKGSLFTYDLYQHATYLQGVSNGIDSRLSILGITQNYVQEYLELDFLNIVLSLFNAIEALGDARNERDNYCWNFYDCDFDIKEFLAQPGPDGLYYYEDDNDDDEAKGRSRDDVLRDYSSFKQSDLEIDESFKLIKSFFPKLEDLEIEAY